MSLHRPKGEMAEKCPIRDVLDRLGDRWTVLIIYELENGTLRFSELRKQIGDISQRMLAQTLRTLEQDGLVNRKVYPTVPPRVEYSLTELGVSLLGPLNQMIAWAADNHEQVRAARAAYVPPPQQVAL
ncbi:hypothetical protein WH50_24850 [Pokkaliibacter plantistimulans]|uniref:HTH hxlR-type domain-containing protein n=1 Tax=Pokkaliibacter plantistimulans TaxID=1635171 RepID=A0ABX5LPV9_9GAMM|nr:helix-turn-helix domain-containing protein [Pokkaliibacter plantistimulans]PXF28705.1 hypothetical protein WH50_24850 [Pokkaliibacter plantistimulans]